MRKGTYAVASLAIAASTLGLGASASASQAKNGTITVSIVGTNILKVNRAISTTYRFPDTIKVRRGQYIEFVNKTVEAHTVTMVREADLPTTINGVFNCTVCNDINAIYSPSGSGPPAGVQIDNGKITDDESDHDADLPDPAIPASVRAHLPFPALVADFNSPAHLVNGQLAGGDSTFVPSVTQHLGVDARTIQVTVSPGTYHYYCTFHAWMQGTLVVTS
jgi:plastocyanin